MNKDFEDKVSDILGEIIVESDTDTSLSFVIGVLKAEREAIEKWWEPLRDKIQNRGQPTYEDIQAETIIGLLDSAVESALCGDGE